MEKYKEPRECPKCNSKEMICKHHRELDHLALKCSVCDYIWTMLPKDRQGGA